MKRGDSRRYEARFGAAAVAGVRNSVARPRIRHSGRSSLPICGVAAISATISGSSSTARS